MASTLAGRLQVQRTSLYLDPSFLSFIDDHLPLIDQDSQTKWVAVEPSQALKYQGDFYGLLTHLNIGFYLHYVVLRLNKLTNPVQPTPGLFSRIRVPEGILIERMLQQWRANDAVRK